MKAKDSQSEGLQRPGSHSSQEASGPPFPGLVWRLFHLATVLRNRQATSDPPVLGILPQIKIRWPSTGACVNKMWHRYTSEYYSALKGKEVLIYATTQVNLEDVTLSEISQSQRNEHWMTPLR